MQNLHALVTATLLVSMFILPSCYEDAPSSQSEAVSKPTEHNLLMLPGGAAPIDILLVFDSPELMFDEPDRLTDMARSIVDAAGRGCCYSPLHYRLGVLDMDMRDPALGVFQHSIDADALSDCGQRPRFIDSRDPRYWDARGHTSSDKVAFDLACNMAAVKRTNTLPTGFDAVQSALERLSNTTGPDAGFLRNRAYLWIMFVTVRDDESSLSVDAFARFLLQRMDDDEPYLLGVTVLSEVAPSSSSSTCLLNSDGADDDSTRYRQLMSALQQQNVVASFECQDNGGKIIYDPWGCLLIDCAYGTGCLWEDFTCEQDEDCPTGACVEHESGRNLCESFEVNVEVERPTYLGTVPERECTQVPSQDCVGPSGTCQAEQDCFQCRLLEGVDYHIYYDEPICTSSAGIGVSVNYEMIPSEESISIRFPVISTEPIELSACQ